MVYITSKNYNLEGLRTGLLTREGFSNRYGKLDSQFRRLEGNVSLIGKSSAKVESSRRVIS
jgi:hypothetical protein